MLKQLSVCVLGSFLLVSCVGSKKYKNVQQEYATLSNKYTQLQSDLKNCEDDKLKMNSGMSSMQSMNDNQKQQIKNLTDQVEYLKTNTNQMLSNLKDLSVISDKQADAVGKSLDKLSERDAYIKDLQGAMARKDSLNLNLVMNLKGAFTDISDNDIDVKVDKGVVFISISDKLLFATGKYDIDPGAKKVLAKVAQVLNNQPNLEFLVEGHTDNVPVTGAVLKDNWDLSALRATSVVRVLQNDYKIDPKRMTAGGRSEYVPVQDNSSAAGRAANRRTRIVVLPQLDQFFQLLEKNATAAPAAK
ncbi:OmpA family protein [soil metagenome]